MHSQYIQPPIAFERRKKWLQFVIRSRTDRTYTPRKEETIQRIPMAVVSRIRGIETTRVEKYTFEVSICANTSREPGFRMASIQIGVPRRMKSKEFV